MLKELFTSVLLSSAIGEPLIPLQDTNALSGVHAYYIGSVDLDFTRQDYLIFGGVSSYDNTIEGSGILCLNTRFKSRCRVALDLDTLDYNIPRVFIHFDDMEIYFNAYCEVYNSIYAHTGYQVVNNFVNSTFSLNSELFPKFISRYQSVTGNTYNVVGEITYLSQESLEDVFSIVFSQVYDGYAIPINIFDNLNKEMTENLFYNAHFDSSLNDSYYMSIFSLSNDTYVKNPIPQIYETFRQYYYGVVSDDHNSLMYQRGYDSGYNAGYESGYSIGFNVGYNQALEVDDTAVTIFNGILSVGMLPINFFLAIFNFEILGINITSFVSAMLSMCLVIIVVRLVTGKNTEG